MDLFAHRIHKAVYLNGVVRLECSIVKPDADGKYQPEAPVPPEDVTFTVNVPLQGFMRSLKEMRDLAAKLHEDGIIKSGEGGGRPGPGRGGGRPEGGQRRLPDISEEDRGGGDGGSDQIV